MSALDGSLLSFKVGRCFVGVLHPAGWRHWVWKGYGYDGLFDEYGFGVWLQIERESDYLLELVETCSPETK